MNMGLVILTAALLATSLTDLAHRRIPNIITYPLAACGLVCHFASAGTNGLIFALTGILAGAALLLPFYMLGGMGAGDVKLLAASGSILGPEEVLVAFLYSALIGGLYAIVVLYRHGALREAIIQLGHTLVGLVLATGFTMPSSRAFAGIPRLCYGVAISLGTVLAVLRPI
jgi:prepilin peptidase CpaA